MGEKVLTTKRVGEAEDHKGTCDWLVDDVSCVCKMCFYQHRQSSMLFSRTSLHPNVGGECLISLRVSIHLQASHQTSDSQTRLFSGPKSLTENSLWLRFVIVAAPPHESKCKCKDKTKTLRNVSKLETNVN